MSNHISVLALHGVVKEMLSGKRWDHPDFLSLLERMQQVLLEEEKLVWNMILKGSSEAHKSFYENTPSFSPKAFTDFSLVSEWVQSLLAIVLLETKLQRRFRLLLKHIKDETKQMGLRFSASRRAKETDVHLWWDDERIDLNYVPLSVRRFEKVLECIKKEAEKNLFSQHLGENKTLH